MDEKSISQTKIPQTLTTIQAANVGAPGQKQFVEKAQEHIFKVLETTPGFVSVCGGPVARSKWEYFGATFTTPEAMDAWNHSRLHRPVIDAGYRKWFDAFYIRKWRMPAEGEALGSPLHLETTILPPADLTQEVVDRTVDELERILPAFDPMPFETARNDFEDRPFQFAGPLGEHPQTVPFRYLLITIWRDEASLERWRQSEEFRKLSELGEVSTRVLVPLLHAPGDRRNLSDDLQLQSWKRDKSQPVSGDSAEDEKVSGTHSS
jgi:hypothetical protein